MTHKIVDAWTSLFHIKIKSSNDIIHFYLSSQSFLQGYLHLQLAFETFVGHFEINYVFNWGQLAFRDQVFKGSFSFLVVPFLISRIQKHLSLVVHKWKSKVFEFSSDFFKHPFHCLLLWQLELQLLQPILSRFACLTCRFLRQYLSFTTNKGPSLVQHIIG